MGLGSRSLPPTGVLDRTGVRVRGLSLVPFCIHVVVWQPSGLLGHPGPGWLPARAGLLEKIGLHSIVPSVN